MNSQEKILNLIEQAVGYRLNENILRVPYLYKLSGLKYNEEDTNLYLSNLYKCFAENEKRPIEQKIDAFEHAFLQLTNNRRIYLDPEDDTFRSRYPFCFLLTKWQDEYGDHLIMKVFSTIKVSDPAVFDVDQMCYQYINVN